MIYIAAGLSDEDKDLLKQGCHELNVVFQDELEVQDQLPSFLEASICFGNPKR